MQQPRHGRIGAEQRALRGAERLGPAAVLVWAQMPATADPTVVDLLPAVRPAVTILVGGPGWRDDNMPTSESVVRVADLADAVGRIVRAVGG